MLIVMGFMLVMQIQPASKNGTAKLWREFFQILTDFQNISPLKRELKIFSKTFHYFHHHLKLVAILPCETQKKCKFVAY